ncbi:MAG: hypothetical protein AAF497_15870, partial [Planctomycetota bacterium]
MSAIIQCKACSKRFKVGPKLAGKKVKCPCGQVMLVPASVGQPAAKATATASPQQAATPKQTTRKQPAT